MIPEASDSEIQKYIQDHSAKHLVQTSIKKFKIANYGLLKIIDGNPIK